MKLSPAAFNRHLAHMGQVIDWRPASACSCLNPFSGAADPQCPQCHGKGQIWAPPVTGVVGITRQEVNPEWKDFGNFEQGDMTLTVGSDSQLYAMGRFDRVIMKNNTDRFSRALTRGENDLSLDMALASIDRVFWLSPDRQTIIEGGIPEWNPVTGALTWTDGEPPVGGQYSIAGTRYEEYFAWMQLPSSRNEHQGAPLPKRVQVRRWDLWGR